MLHSRNLVPKYLTEHSKDIHTFLGLIDLAFNNNKAKTDDFVNILNPDKCPNQLLPLLASYVGYKYDYNETYDSNRIIIRSYKDMIKNKGNITGIQLATSIAISMVADKSLIDAQELLNVTFYDYYYRCPECGYIAYEPFTTCPRCDYSGEITKIDSDTIVIVIEYPLYSAKSYDLIEAVRPAGVGCILYNGTLVNQVDTIGISDFIKLQSKFLNDGMSEVGGVDAVSGFTPILRETPTYRYCEVCGTYISNYLEVFEYESDTTYYSYSDITGNWTELEINSEVDFYDAIKKSKIYKVNIVQDNLCPKCGSNLVTENNSSLRLLFRLCSDINEYNANIKSIISNINNKTIENSSNSVGVILRLHLKSNFMEEYHTASTKYPYITLDWSCDFTQSFIFGLKPYINFNKNGENIDLFEYEVRDILDKLSNSNNTDLKTLRNVNKNFQSFDFVKDNGTYVIRGKQEFTLDDGTPVIQTHDYPFTLNESTKLYSISVSENENSVDNLDYYGNGELVENIIENLNDTFDFNLGNDTRVDTESLKKIEGEEDTSKTFVDYKGNYIYVCRACNNIIGVTDDTMDVCPICGGVITPNDMVISSSQQLYDHTILQGSYVLDLYFEDTEN